MRDNYDQYSSCLSDDQLPEVHHHSIESSRKISLLPDEILEIILSYFTDHFQGILSFSLICKEWKQIADCSRLWLSCDLSFHSSNKYYSAYKTTSTMNISHYSHTVYLFDEEIHYAPRMYLIKVIRENPQALRAKGKLSVREGDRHPTENNTKGSEERGERSPSEQATEIRKRFMKIFLRYHQLWHWNAPKILWLQKWRLSFIDLTERVAVMIFLLTPLFLGLAVYLLQNIPSQDLRANLTVANHCGFVCMYLYVLQCVLLSLVTIPDEMFYDLCISTKDMVDFINWKAFCPSLIAFTFIFGILITVGLLHYSLSSPAFPYSCIPIPLWLGFSFSFALSLSAYKEKIAILQGKALMLCKLAAVTIGVTLPLGFTLVGVYYDYYSDHKSNNSFLNNVLILFCPIELAACIAFLLSIAQNIKLLLLSERNERKFFRYIVIGGIALLRTVCLGGTFASMVYVHVTMIVDAQSNTLLSRCLTSLMIWFFCVTYAWYFLMFSNL